MAFNPFHTFRKHQRVIFAILTIACMFVFVLTGFSGGCSGTFGGPTAASGPLLTTFKFSSSMFSTQTPVYQIDFDKEARRRRLANNFVRYVVQRGTSEALDKLRSTPTKKDSTIPQPNIDPLLREYLNNYDQRNSQLRQSQPPRERIQQIQENMQRVAFLRQNPTGFDKDQAKADKLVKDADTLLAALRFELWVNDVALVREELGEKGRNLEQYYFGGTPSLDDTLDFMIWKHQAKRLGIEYTPADVRKGLNRLIGVGDKFSLEGNLLDNPYAADYFKGTNQNREDNTDRDVKELEEALADEFRVQTAQVTLLGEPSSSASSVVVATGIYQPTTSPTPDEFLEYYRDKRTTLKVEMMAVPVKSFIDPKDDPPENLLQDLYNKYHSVEPSPERVEPAFKVPRKLRVEYATGDPEATMFVDQAKILALHPAVLRVSAFASAFPAGGGAGWALAVSPALQDDPIERLYLRYQQTQDSEVLHKDGTTPAVYDRSFHAASTVADLLGNLQQGSPLNVASTQVGADAIYQTAAARTAGTAVMLATDPSPFTLGALTRYPALNTARPFPEVARELLAKEEKSIAQTLVVKTLVEVRKELEKIGAEPDAANKAKLYLVGVEEKYRDKDTNKLGVHITGMTASKDRYGLTDDPFFKPLDEAFLQYLNQLRRAVELAQMGEKFGGDISKQWRNDYINLLMEVSPLIPNQDAHSLSDNLLQNTLGTYKPFFVPAVNQTEVFLIWSGEDVAAHEVPYEQAKPEVIAAQRLIDARQSALKYLDALTNKELKDKAATWPEDSAKRAQEVKVFLESQKQGRVFELNNVARVVTPDTLPNMGSDRPYFAYSPPAAELPFPPANLVDRLMTMQKPGDATTVKDRPQTTFYVAVLLDRNVPTLDDFRKVYQNAAGRIEHDPLWDNLMGQRRVEFQKQFIRRLREEATGDLDKEGRINVPDDVRKKFDRSER